MLTHASHLPATVVNTSLMSNKATALGTLAFISVVCSWSCQVNSCLWKGWWAQRCFSSSLVRRVRGWQERAKLLTAAFRFATLSKAQHAHKASSFNAQKQEKGQKSAFALAQTWVPVRLPICLYAAAYDWTE